MRTQDHSPAARVGWTALAGVVLLNFASQAPNNLIERANIIGLKVETPLKALCANLQFACPCSGLRPAAHFIQQITGSAEQIILVYFRRHVN